MWSNRWKLARLLEKNTTARTAVRALYCSKFVNILFKKYLAISLSNFYDYLWHLHSMGQPGCFI